MKIVYCNHSVYNPGGMERTLYNKLCYLSQMPGCEVVLVTTDQNGRAPFYPFPEGVRMVDLGINYSEDNDKGLLRKIAGYLRRRRLHRKRLTELLRREKADIVVSLFPSESSFIPKIDDGSKKVLELHFCKFFRLQYGRKGLLGLIDKWRTRRDESLVRRFDKFVVLTEEDRGYWGALPNIKVIPNAAILPPQAPEAEGDRPKRVIAVGRLDYQKGFDRLIRAWAIVARRYPDWRLDIFGQGEWRDMLQGIIDEAGLQDVVRINAPTKDIAGEYARSAMLAMSSHYEGFPMVMIEAMAAGLPVATFDYKCGPRDIITPGVDGMIVPEGDVEALARAIMDMIGDPERLRRMSAEARKVTERYSQERIMGMWLDLFAKLTNENV